jgi:uncharacterized protein (TIGR02145 family)
MSTIKVLNDNMRLPIISNIGNLDISIGDLKQYTTPQANLSIVRYGLLYNGYVMLDVRGAAPIGWKVPSETDWQTLVTFLGTSTVAGGKLKGIRTAPEERPRWDAPNTGATDEVNFNGYAAGQRSQFQVFQLTDQQALFWTTTFVSGTTYRVLAMFNNTATTQFSNYTAVNGLPIRCIYDGVGVPTSPIVKDASGNDYTWINIGTQYWLQQNLKTTNYNNGDPITYIWGFSDTFGAYAYPNNDITLV